ncbi:hypothetical protein [Pseudarthrobacter sp. S9]|uniref:hypothetical protein n=1 Tax=Pseudarthrobacter sp. S9 TaxID=3418421 RepID=UPI003CFBC78C
MDGTLQLIVNIGAAATALAAIIGLPLAFVKLWPVIKRAVTLAVALEKLPEMAQELGSLSIGQRAQAETLEHQNAELKIIKHEVEFNNGSSVKDAVVRNEKATAELTKEFREYVANGQPPTTTINVNPGGSQ